MKYAKIRKLDVTNGPGVRTTLFVSGCTHNCEGCFNKEADRNFFSFFFLQLVYITKIEITTILTDGLQTSFTCLFQVEEIAG